MQNITAIEIQTALMPLKIAINFRAFYYLFLYFSDVRFISHPFHQQSILMYVLSNVLFLYALTFWLI